MIENDYFFDFGEYKFQGESVAGLIDSDRVLDDEQHKQNVLRLLEGEGEENAGPYWLRFIVERDFWHVPTRPDGTFELLNTRKGEYKRLVAGASKRDGRRTIRQGTGGQMLPVYTRVTESGDNMKYRVMDGRTLVRSLPSGISGLLIQVEDNGGLRELSAEFFQNLVLLADAVEMEDALMHPGKVETAGLKEYLFQAAIYKGELWRHKDVAVIGTHIDRIDINDDEVELKRISGGEILDTLRKNANFCGILVNPGQGLGRKGKDVRGLCLSLNFAARARKESKTLVTRVPSMTVRSREEFELWLKQVFFPVPFEIMEKSDEKARVFLQAVSKQEVERWSFYECEYAENSHPAVTPLFLLQQSPGSDEEIAAGPSSILCPGLLAKSLYSQLPEVDRSQNLFRPGIWLGVARLLSDDDLALSRQRVKLATELLKLIPAGASEISRDSILSVEGARFLNWAGFAGKRAWVESALKQARRFRARFVLGV